MKYFFSILSMLLCLSLEAQNSLKIDSLQRLIDQYLKADTHKVFLINNLADSYLNFDPAKSELLATQARKMAQTIGYKMGEGWSWNYQGSSYLIRANYDSALLCYRQALILFEEYSKLPEPIAKIRYNIGLVHFYQGNTAQALDFLIDAMNLYHSSKLIEEEANVINAIASVYASQGQYRKALNNYLKVLKIGEVLNSDYLFNNVFHNLASVYYDLYVSLEDPHPSWLDSSLYYNRKSISIRSKVGNRNGLAASQISLGNIYLAKQMYGLALEAFGSALKLKTELGDKRGQAICYENLAEVNFKLKHYALAVSMVQSAIKLYQEIESAQDLLSSYRLAANIYQTIGRYKDGFGILESYIKLSDSIFTKEKAAELAEMETRYELSRQSAESRLKDVELEKDRFWLGVYFYGIAFAVVILVVMAGLFIQAIKNRKKAMLANAELYARNLELAKREEQVRAQSEILIQANEEISSTNEALMFSQNLIAEINRDFTSSLNYAKTIQAALLPTVEQLHQIFPQSFVFLRPKEQVSGDLFWVFQGQDTKLIAAIDCTGHGVPGGFMSIAAVFLLNQICRTQPILSPDLILKHLHADLRAVLRQENATIRDGMEIGLCAWDEASQTLSFAGAGSNMIYMIENQIFEFKGERFAIGDEHSDGRTFCLHKIELKQPFVGYLFTDGYRDQFGGEKGRKFMARRFKELLYDIHRLDCYDQSQVLERNFLEWTKGQYTQIDDVLVLGFKLN
jgi:tetratricopeptide (TPR) repeat protein